MMKREDLLHDWDELESEHDHDLKKCVILKLKYPNIDTPLRDKGFIF